MTDSGNTLVNDVDSYIASFPPKVQKVLQQVRRTIKKTVPGAEELISYKMPAYKYHGWLLAFAGWKNHISLYPAPWGAAELKKEMSAYEGSKGTIKFPLDKPMPLPLISKIVIYRIQKNLEKENVKKNMVKAKETGKTIKANYIKYHNDGSIWAKGNLKQGHPDGYWEWFRKDGVIMRSGYFNKGKQTGEWTTYDKKGKVFKVTQMK